MKYINVIDAKEHFSNPALNPKRRQFGIAKERLSLKARDFHNRRVIRERRDL